MGIKMKTMGNQEEMNRNKQEINRNQKEINGNQKEFNRNSHGRSPAPHQQGKKGVAPPIQERLEAFYLLALRGGHSSRYSSSINFPNVYGAHPHRHSMWLVYARVWT